MIRSAIEGVLDRIGATDDTLHAFITVLADAARSDADEADERASRGEPPRPLEGVTAGIKDNVDVAGAPTTCGLASRRTHVAPHDAAIVRQLRAAGAIVMGKLNMNEGALGTDSANPHFGAVANPVRPDLIPGGSSGGSAAAVAGELCRIALGTDTLGSVRVPASCCDVVGFKPSRGAVPAHGLVGLWDAFDVIGVLGKRVEDVMPAVDVMLARPVRSLGRPLRIGIPGDLAALGADATVVERFAAVRGSILDLASTTTELSIDADRLTDARRAAFTLAEFGAHAAYRDDVAVGGVSAGLASLVRYGEQLSDDDLDLALRRVAIAGVSFAGWFDDVDIAVLPTMPVLGLPAGMPPPVNVVDLTAPASILGAPALSLPTPRSGDDPPFGVQIVARPGADDVVLEMGLRLEAAW